MEFLKDFLGVLVCGSAVAAPFITDAILNLLGA